MTSNWITAKARDSENQMTTYLVNLDNVACVHYEYPYFYIILGNGNQMQVIDVEWCGSVPTAINMLPQRQAADRKVAASGAE